MHDFPLGGTERIALRLARAWGKMGVRVVLFVGEPRGPLRALLPDTTELIAADPPIARRRGSRERLGEAAADHFTRYPVDALFVPGNYHWEVVPALARMARRPTLLVQVSSPLRMPQRGVISQWRFHRRMRKLLRGADALVAMNDRLRDDTDAVMGRPIATAIPLPALNDDAPPRRRATGRTILAAGRLIDQKGFDLLIEAFRRLDDPGAHLVIVGSGPEQASLERQARASGVAERIRFEGYQSDIRPFLDEARLFVMASRFEGYGAVIVEALDAGRPVTATASTPAVDDLLGDPERGIVVPVEDVQALTVAIRTLLDRPAPDPDRLASAVDAYRIGVGARAYLGCFAAAAA